MLTYLVLQVEGFYNLKNFVDACQLPCIFDNIIIISVS